MTQDDLKKHLIDILKGLIAAIFIAAIQAAISYLAGVDWNHVFAFLLQAAAATLAVKTQRIHV